MKRAQDWMRQAEHDLAHARRGFELGDYDWACFAAHQAAEKAVKAVYLWLGGEVFGRVLRNMLAGFEERFPIDSGLKQCALELDRLYIPTRYPDSWEGGAPLDYYGEEDARRAVVCAEAIVRFGQGVLAGQGGVD